MLGMQATAEPGQRAAAADHHEPAAAKCLAGRVEQAHGGVGVARADRAAHEGQDAIRAGVVGERLADNFPERLPPNDTNPPRATGGRGGWAGHRPRHLGEQRITNRCQELPDHRGVRPAAGAAACRAGRARIGQENALAPDVDRAGRAAAKQRLEIGGRAGGEECGGAPCCRVVIAGPLAASPDTDCGHMTALGGETGDHRPGPASQNRSASGAADLTAREIAPER